MKSKQRAKAAAKIKARLSTSLSLSVHFLAALSALPSFFPPSLSTCLAAYPSIFDVVCDVHSSRTFFMFLNPSDKDGRV